MPFHGAMLPGGAGRGQDRWTTTRTAAIVLDGASSFAPDTADASEYVDLLLSETASRIDEDEELQAVLETAIRATSEALKLQAGVGPSSTVLLARLKAERLEVLALGDSTAVVKTSDGTVHRISDDRLSRTAAELRHRYRQRLMNGSGYDDEHRSLLGQLQQHERRERNVPYGYWIAEADPQAAKEAVCRQFDMGNVEWCVLATDGAQRVVDHLGVHWESVALMANHELVALLRRLHDWEQFEDPTAKFLPRAKQHDDKVLVTWTQ
ncbi:protein phosphatase 2C domain-containing protein [Lentzea jiangxiensis]|uniref:Protein phosphatase 2C n=1 Tax=Lentzea jiangxiensis TaxID=641025 RepID=A0A1H0U461_9PSEU|nr:protein phosphatase 2C domain-containing protein [Lentzea jiangxiensis]SDP60959.1 Protein phosphatase 2C [Lentzea jiangxiensis]